MAALDWTRYGPYIEAALEYTNGTHDLDDIIKAVAAGTLQVWPGERSVILTEIHDTPKKRLLHVFLAGGHLAELDAMYEPIEAWSKTRGCVGVTMTGRPGWARTFLTRDKGWVPRWQHFEKDY